MFRGAYEAGKSTLLVLCVGAGVALGGNPPSTAPVAPSDAEPPAKLSPAARAMWNSLFAPVTLTGLPSDYFSFPKTRQGDDRPLAEEAALIELYNADPRVKAAIDAGRELRTAAGDATNRQLAIFRAEDEATRLIADEIRQSFELFLLSQAKAPAEARILLRDAERESKDRTREAVPAVANVPFENWGRHTGAVEKYQSVFNFMVEEQTRRAAKPSEDQLKAWLQQELQRLEEQKVRAHRDIALHEAALLKKFYVFRGGGGQKQKPLSLTLEDLKKLKFSQTPGSHITFQHPEFGPLFISPSADAYGALPSYNAGSTYRQDLLKRGWRDPRYDSVQDGHRLAIAALRQRIMAVEVMAMKVGNATPFLRKLESADRSNVYHEYVASDEASGLNEVLKRWQWSNPKSIDGFRQMLAVASKRELETQYKLGTTNPYLHSEHGLPPSTGSEIANAVKWSGWAKTPWYWSRQHRAAWLTWRYNFDSHQQQPSYAMLMLRRARQIATPFVVLAGLAAAGSVGWDLVQGRGISGAGNNLVDRTGNTFEAGSRTVNDTITRNFGHTEQPAEYAPNDNPQMWEGPRGGGNGKAETIFEVAAIEGAEKTELPHLFRSAALSELKARAEKHAVKPYKPNATKATFTVVTKMPFASVGGLLNVPVGENTDVLELVLKDSKGKVVPETEYMWVLDEGGRNPLGLKIDHFIPGTYSIEIKGAPKNPEETQWRWDIPLDHAVWAREIQLLEEAGFKRYAARLRELRPGRHVTQGLVQDVASAFDGTGLYSERPADFQPATEQNPYVRYAKFVDENATQCLKCGTSAEILRDFYRRTLPKKDSIGNKIDSEIRGWWTRTAGKNQITTADEMHATTEVGVGPVYRSFDGTPKQKDSRDWVQRQPVKPGPKPKNQHSEGDPQKSDSPFQWPAFPKLPDNVDLYTERRRPLPFETEKKAKPPAPPAPKLAEETRQPSPKVVPPDLLKLRENIEALEKARSAMLKSVFYRPPERDSLRTPEVFAAQLAYFVGEAAKNSSHFDKLAQYLEGRGLAPVDSVQTWDDVLVALKNRREESEVSLQATMDAVKARKPVNFPQYANPAYRTIIVNIEKILAENSWESVDRLEAGAAAHGAVRIPKEPASCAGTARTLATAR